LLNPLSFLKNVNDSDNNHALKIKVGEIIKKSKKKKIVKNLCFCILLSQLLEKPFTSHELILFHQKEWFVKQIIYLFEFIILKIAYQDFLKPIRKPVIHTLTRISLTDIVI